MAKKSTKKVDPKIVSSSSNIRMKSPNSKSRSSRLSNASIKTDVIVGGFVDFLKNHSVVTLAVGFVIATQVQGLVKQLVDSFITPTIQFFFKNSLTSDSITIHLSDRTIVYTWGQFANQFLVFFFVLIAIYLIIKAFRLDKLTPPKS